MENYKKLDANMIKLIAILAMTIDHITWMVFPGYPKNFAPILLHIIGRITCPIMCYFIAEGYHYTKNVSKYTNRLFAFAFLSHFAYVFASMHFVELEVVYSFLLWKCIRSDKCYVVTCMGTGYAAGNEQSKNTEKCGKNNTYITYLPD